MDIVLSILRLARPADWCKNLFVFPALLASGKATDLESIFLAGIAFVAFSFTASGVYAINDALDWKHDQGHPVKKTRPVAAEEITPAIAWMAGLGWITAGLLLSLFTGGWNLMLVLAAYLILQTLYNIKLKKYAMVDVVSLSLGFVLRSIAGAVAIGVPASIWMLAVVFFLCLYLAQIKRLCDLSSVRLNSDSHETWITAAGYKSTDELNWMLALSASLSVTTLLFYSLSDHVLETAGAGGRGLALLTPLVIVAMYRFYRAALRGISDSPFRIITTDRIVMACSATFAAVSAFLLVSPRADEIMIRLFGN